MVVELTASRILAPLLGSSLYTWTSAIGTVLLGMSIGNYIGGLYIDKYNSKKTLSYFFLLTSLLIASIPIFSRYSEWLVMLDTSLIVKVLTVSFYIFLLPAISFGMIYPAIIKLYLVSVEGVGKKAGLISAAWSTGSIVGTFLTGFFFIGYMGSTKTVFSMSLILLVCAFLVDFPKKKLKIALILISILSTVLLSSFISKPKNLDNLIYYKESNYYTIKVAEIDNFRGNDVRFLVLDFDTHSLESDSSLDMYTSIYPVFSFFNKNIENIVVIGGGSNKLSKNIADYYKTAQVKNIEIDPAVSFAAEKFFDPSIHPITNINSDGRVFLRNSDEKYDLIFVDAYNSFISIPWHMTTLEFNELAKSKLTEKGMMGINFSSALEGDNSELFQSMYKTFRTSFRNVYVFRYIDDPSILQNIVFIGTNSFSVPNSESLVHEFSQQANTIKFAKKLYLKSPTISTSATLLTDEYAPTEKLMLKSLNSYFDYFAKFYYSFF